MATTLEDAATRYAEARQAFDSAVSAHKEATTQLGALQDAMHAAGTNYRVAESELLKAASPGK